MQSQKQQKDLGSFSRQTIQHHFDQIYAPTTDAEEAEVNQFYEDLQDLLELTPKKKRCPFHRKELECKRRMSGDTWNNSKVWTLSTK